MKVVMAVAPQTLLEERCRKGLDRFDEIWAGVLHMPPMPNRSHQDLEWAVETWIRNFWVTRRGGRAYHQINVATPGGWPDKDYRIPDLVLLTPDRFYIDKNEYFEGAPTVVVEIRSPEDETYQKLDFYSALEVPEVWIIDRDTKVPEIHEHAQNGYHKLAASDDGWLVSKATGIRLRCQQAGKLSLQLGSDESTRNVVP
jgi:Uma2 family endonuclease